MKLRVVVMVASAVLCARVAVGDPWMEPANSDAKKHLDDGRALFQTQKWDAAINEFEQGYRLEALPIWLYNLGQSHRHAGHYKQAQWYFERFIAAVNDDPDAAEAIAQARQLAEDMRAAADREPQSVAPPPAASVRKTNLGPPPRWYEDWIGLSGLGGSIIVAGAGTGFLLDARSIDRRADTEPNEATRESLYSQADTRRTIGWIGVGVGVVAAAVFTVKLALPHDTSSRESATAILIGPSSFSVMGRF